MRRADPEQMARWLARGEREGLSRAELARRSGEPMWKLRWWERRFARTRGRARQRRGFVAVELSAPGPSAPVVLELTTPSGHRVGVPADFDAAHLARLLRVLGAAC